MADTTTNNPAIGASDADILKLADRIKNGDLRRIVVLTGAGISTSAGIPDFRSPISGLYAKLAPLRLPYPEAPFTYSYFTHTPEPFYALARIRHPGNLKPTLSHAFLALLARKNLLHFLFTQNVDGLEANAGIPEEKILWVHGNWRSQHCHKCKDEYPADLMKKAIREGEVAYCLKSECGGAVKPNIVFFGQSLPAAFDEKEKLVEEADLFIVMGTSLKVAPASQLPRKAKEGVPRILINLERSGDMGHRPDDLCILGGCDDGVRRLAEALGWVEELEELWKTVFDATKHDPALDGGPTIEECIENIAKQMDEKSKISNGHKRMLEDHLSAKFANILGPKKD